MRNDRNQNYPPAVGQRVKYVAPPFRVAAPQSFTENRANLATTKRNGPRIGLVVGVAAFAGFLGGILWSKVAKKREGAVSGHVDEVDEANGADDKSD